MAWKTFETKTSGKWVLAGEHTVLRGGSAIALPQPDFSLTLSFVADETASLAVSPDLASVVLQDLLRVGREWLALRGVSMPWPKGYVSVKSTIPVGSGLGSSAALSVATARWVLSAHALDPKLEIELAQEMENRFHGKSSGMDVTVVSLGEPLVFSMKKGAEPLRLAKLPRFIFRDTGIRAATKDCIEKVQRLRVTNPAKSMELDSEMALATHEVLEGLRAFQTQGEAALGKIAEGMARAHRVFEGWELNPDEAKAVIEAERKNGALASRVTGAGGGGFVVSLYL